MVMVCVDSDCYDDHQEKVVAHTTLNSAAAKNEETTLEGARAQNPSSPKVKSAKTIVDTSDDHDSLKR
jgi:hypothetical protein